jgi:hypothetical protein
VHDTDERAPWDTGQGVTAGADFTVNLETTAEAGCGKFMSVDARRQYSGIGAEHSRSVVEGLVEALVNPGVVSSVQTG